MLNSRLRVRQKFGIRRENLVIRILNLEVLLLNDSFYSLMECEVEAFFRHRLKRAHDCIAAAATVFFDEALRGIDDD